MWRKFITSIALLMLLAVFDTRAELIPLSPPSMNGGMPLLDALAARKSQRAFATRPLADETLSTLLWAAFGVNRPEEGKRTAPSAMNAREIDIYLARADGLFLYEPEPHHLVRLSAEDIRDATGRQAFVRDAPLVLVYVADMDRMRAPDEALRVFYSAVNTGYISQNVYLYCAANELATVVLGWVDKPALARRMGLLPNQRVILSQPVGYPSGIPVQDREADDAAMILRDGVYRGTARGHVADITVEVTVQDGKIAGVATVQHRENRPLTALTEIPARIMKAQGTDGVDAVTGATTTSRAVRNAVDQALQAAGK